MGCDIHCYVETLRSGSWHAEGDWICEYPDEDAVPDVPYKQRFSDRNYNAFAILADVRNGRGTAGCDTGDGFNPICEPRGLPSDVTGEVKAVSDRWGIDGHSHSFFRLAELLEFDWTQTTKLRGLAMLSDYYGWARYGRDQGQAPREYCGGVYGPGIKIVSAEEADNIVAACRQRIEALNETQRPWEHEGALREELEQMDEWNDDIRSRYYVRCEWTQPYYRCAGNFTGEFIYELMALSQQPGVEDVRIVFWFDN